MKQIVFPQAPLKRRMLYKFHSLLHVSMIDILLSHTTDTDGTVILMYHSIASDEYKRWIDPKNHLPVNIFERHIRFLAKKRNVISLDTLINSIKDNKPLTGGTTVITFDDGYLDNFTVAAPILKKYDLPATIYLATGYVEREESQWVDQLFTFFNERTKDRLIIPEISEDVIELHDPDSTWEAYFQILKYLIISTYRQRTQLLASIKKQLDPNQIPPRLTMNWDDVRTLLHNNKNITLGSHTCNHIDISRLDKNDILSEIKKSTEDIERETGQRPVHFSCPYSRTAENLPAVLKNLGYMTSVSDSADILINSKSYPFSLGRIAVPASLSRLAHYTSGNYPTVSKLIMGGRY